ncbi:hypothetical protein yc1106_00368 [Curvularia clavata]|uniref:Uncharacterized protein n=1 Tax=Curvularia clavata TaxID=95742 RepID=A0A9Q8YZU7_CURCL|nr:hypothetical protein yc1106_00368 [Curvularia clavata]
MYVLMKPVDGLCSLFNVPGDEVFYFSEFRDLTKASEPRPRNWNALVKQVSLSGKAAATPKNTANSTAVVMVDPAVAFANEVLALSSSFSIKKDPWILQELRKTLDQACATPLNSYPNIDALVNQNEGNDEGDKDDQQKPIRRSAWSAEETLQELKRRWPQTAQMVTPRLLETIRNGLDECEDFKIQAHEVQPLLRLAACLEEEPGAASNSKVAAAWVSSAVMAMRAARFNVKDPGHLPRTSIRDGSFPALLSATVDALKIVRDNNRAHSQALRQRLGNNTILESPATLWEMFGNTQDDDAARGLYEAWCRLVLKQFENTANVIDPQLEHILWNFSGCAMMFAI